VDSFRGATARESQATSIRRLQKNLATHVCRLRRPICEILELAGSRLVATAFAMPTNEGHSLMKYEAILRRHSQDVLLAGAIVVFVTFVVREGVREHLKDLVDSISNAQSTRVSNLTLGILYIQTQSAIDALHGLTHVPPTVNSNGRDQKLSVDPTVDTVEHKMAVLLNQVTLATTLFDDAKLIASRIDEDKMSSAQIERLEPAVEHAKKCKEELAIFDSATFDVCERSTKLTLEAVQQLESSILDVAHAAQDRGERWYKRCTWASYFLYALGWSLGVAGKKYDD
jgi:hypothetical protein